MKTIMTAGVAFLLGLSAVAQHVPDRLNYQAILTNSKGEPQVNSTNTVRFRIYDEAEAGNLIWGETHSVTTSPCGLFNVTLGTGSSLGEYMAVENLRAAFASGTLVAQRYLELQALNVDTTAQSPILPRQRFMTVPYAFQANDSQEAASDFRVTGALYASRVGMEANRLIMTNPLSSVTVAGDLRVDGYGKSSVAVNFSSNSWVRSTSADAFRAGGALTANQTMTVGGTATFYRGVSAANPVFKKGASVKGGIRALGAYKSLGSSIKTNLPAQMAAGDGFVLVYYKTDGWNEDADLIVTVGSQQFPLEHDTHSSGDKRGMHFYDTACIPVAKGSTWSIAWGSGEKDNSNFDVYWIPFGY